MFDGLERKWAAFQEERREGSKNSHRCSIKKRSVFNKNFSTIKEVYKLKRTQEGREREGRKESG